MNRSMCTVTVVPGTYQAIYQTDQMQCPALNQYALSMSSHSHQSRNPKPTKKQEQIKIYYL